MRSLSSIPERGKILPEQNSNSHLLSRDDIWALFLSGNAPRSCREKIGLIGSTIFKGDALQILRSLPSESVQCAVTSPPYWGLRDYHIDGQIGLEPTLPQFINRLVAVFNEVKRILKQDGILWLNIGDGYTSGNRGWRAPDRKNSRAGDECQAGYAGGPQTQGSSGCSVALGFCPQAGWLVSEKRYHLEQAQCDAGERQGQTHTIP